jgi:hypothetical protein
MHQSACVIQAWSVLHWQISLTSYACFCVQVVSSLVPAEVGQGNGDPASIPLPTTDAAQLQVAAAWQVCP